MATQAITTQQTPPPQIQSPQKDVRSLIMSSAFQDQIKKAMPEAMSSDVLLRVAVTTIQKTPKLLECSRESLMQCVLECAQLGLLPDGILGQAYMVPYSKVATLQIGYRGILELARRSNQIRYVVGEAVYQCDKFNIEYAPKRSITHVPAIDDEHRGEVEKGKYLPSGFRGAYALVIYKDDSIDFEYLPLHKIERIRASSQAGSKADGPWLNHFEEMAKKTAIRSLGKRLPLSADDQRKIIEDEYRDNGVDVGYTVDAGVSGIVRDEETEFLMDALGWSETKRLMSRRNFAGDRDGHLAYVKAEAAKAGLSLGNGSASNADADSAKESVAADPTPSSTETGSTPMQGKSDQTSSAEIPSKEESSRATGTTAEASTSQASEAQPVAAKTSATKKKVDW